jgi:Fe2+ or Zn2+ uptake regulation protein
MKLEEDNHVHIICTSEDTIIKIQDQFQNENNETEFIDLYKVKIYS